MKIIDILINRKNEDKIIYCFSLFLLNYIAFLLNFIFSFLVSFYSFFFFSAFYLPVLLYNILKYFYFCLLLLCPVWCSYLSVISSLSSFCDCLFILFCYLLFCLVLNFYPPPPHTTNPNPNLISSPFVHCLHLYDLSICHFTSVHYTLPSFCYPYFSILFYAFNHTRNQI